MHRYLEFMHGVQMSCCFDYTPTVSVSQADFQEEKENEKSGRYHSWGRASKSGSVRKILFAP
jgi:hypothetical protein